MLRLTKGSHCVENATKKIGAVTGPILRMRLQRSVEFFSFLFDDLLR
jgi:hypothetical protein